MAPKSSVMVTAISLVYSTGWDSAHSASQLPLVPVASCMRESLSVKHHMGNTQKMERFVRKYSLKVLKCNLNVHC